jgi:hypothetical protein
MLDAGPDARLVRMVGRVPFACTSPCALDWPSSSNLVVVAGGGTWPIVLDRPSRGRPVVAGLGGFDASELTSFASTFESELRHLGNPEYALVGGEETPTIVGGITIHPQNHASADPDDLDTYLQDVVLVTSPALGCTGVAIASRAVLTARHCASATHVGVEREDRRIESFAVVTRASPPNPALDVVVLGVDHDLGVTIRPRAASLTELPATGVARLVGFGTTDVDGRLGFGLKRQAFVGVSGWTCDPISARATGCAPGLEVAFAADTADTCLGDSGGPVLDVVDGRWRLVAIASRGIPGFGTECGHGGIYTHVGAFADWLKAELSKER